MRPKVYVFTTGGTIASRSGEHGSAVMDLGPEALVSLLDIQGVDLQVKGIMQKGSINVAPDDWKVIAECAAEVIQMKPQGVVILHGTDTMHYTASAVSFMLRDLSVPIVFTGSMIPGGDPGSDSLSNLRDAITVAAYSDIGEVCIVFSSDRDRRKASIIRGCRARKIHSYAIDSFDSINVPPIGYIENGRITYTELKRYKREDRRLKFSTEFDTDVVLIKLTPALTSQTLARFLEGASGAVLEGTGVGHIPAVLQGVIASFKKPTVMSTQTIYGGERLGMYDTDQSILDIENIIPVRDMTSEAAFVKLMWALSLGGDIKSLMLTNMVGEISG